MYVYVYIYVSYQFLNYNFQFPKCSKDWLQNVKRFKHDSRNPRESSRPLAVLMEVLKVQKHFCTNMSSTYQHVMSWTYVNRIWSWQRLDQRLPYLAQDLPRVDHGKCLHQLMQGTGHGQQTGATESDGVTDMTRHKVVFKFGFKGSDWTPEQKEKNTLKLGRKSEHQS